MFLNIKKTTILIMLLIVCAAFYACGLKDGESNGEKLEFTVVEESDIPEQLLKIINEKKLNPFKLIYTNDSYLYIVQGYGTQTSGGYSIAVRELSMKGDKILFKTELLGPSQKDSVIQSATYPYIAVKMEKIDKEILFE